MIERILKKLGFKRFTVTASYCGPGTKCPSTCERHQVRLTQYRGNTQTRPTRNLLLKLEGIIDKKYKEIQGGRIVC